MLLVPRCRYLLVSLLRIGLLSCLHPTRFTRCRSRRFPWLLLMLFRVSRLAWWYRRRVLLLFGLGLVRLRRWLFVVLRRPPRNRPRHGDEDVEDFRPWRGWSRWGLCDVVTVRKNRVLRALVWALGGGYVGRFSLPRRIGVVGCRIVFGCVSRYWSSLVVFGGSLLC